MKGEHKSKPKHRRSVGLPGGRAEIEGRSQTRQVSFHIAPKCRGRSAVNVNSPNEDCGVIC